MARSDVHWKGLKALEVMVDFLPTKIAKAKVKDAYTYALTPTKNTMLMYIPSDRTGALKHSIDITHGGGQELQRAFAVVGPRRKRHVWNMQGWHSFLVEQGTKRHTIQSKSGKGMPVFQGGGVVKYVKSIEHPGTKGTKPFTRAVDVSWGNVADRVADKLAEVMRDEIKAIFVQYGDVVTKSGDVIPSNFRSTAKTR